MTIKQRLTVLSFLQFFVWGAWLITIGNYWFQTKHWSGSGFGAIFATLGISSIFMPALAGIIADRFINAERLFALLHLLSGLAMFYLPQINDAETFYYVVFAAMLFYMPTIALFNSISYTILKQNNFEAIKTFPPIRVWGTVGFIVAMWVTNLSGNKASENMFYISAITSVVLVLYTITLPQCRPPHSISGKASLTEQLGLNAFSLFRNYTMASFFIFSMFLGVALQLTNMYGDVYLSEFVKNPIYTESLVVRYSTIVMSISQISEIFFILCIPFFMGRFGIKTVMTISMLAWVLRFGLLAFGNPGDGLWMILLSCVIYGTAFDFFFISGSLFVEMSVRPEIKSSAQGLFMMMANGIGAFLGGTLSGVVIDQFFTHNNQRDWFSIWISFSVYALVILIAFVILFKNKYHSGFQSVC